MMNDLRVLVLALFEQPPIVVRLCVNLGSLANVISLAKCSRLFRARVRQCFPELARIAELRAQTTTWHDLSKALMNGPPLQPFTWHYLWREMYRHGGDTLFITHCFDVKAGHLVDILLSSMTGQWMCNIMGGYHNIPLQLYNWYRVDIEAMLHFDEEWAKRAEKVLLAAYKQQGALSHDEWLTYRDWYITICVPHIKQLARQVQETRNANFIREFLKQQMEMK